MRQCTGKKFRQTLRDLVRKRTRFLNLCEEVVLAFREPKGFEDFRRACTVIPNQHEVARVGHDHQPIASPIACDLRAFSRHPRIIAD